MLQATFAYARFILMVQFDMDRCNHNQSFNPSLPSLTNHATSQTRTHARITWIMRARCLPTGRFSEGTNKPVYHEDCLGKRTELQTIGGDTKSFKSYKDSIDLSNYGPLSIHTKFDIEGSEWAVFSTFTEEDYAKIVIFDVELHFCLPSVYRGGMTKEHFPATVKRQLALCASRVGNYVLNTRKTARLVCSELCKLY